MTQWVARDAVRYSAADVARMLDLSSPRQVTKWRGWRVGCQDSWKHASGRRPSPPLSFWDVVEVQHLRAAAAVVGIRGACDLARFAFENPDHPSFAFARPLIRREWGDLVANIAKEHPRGDRARELLDQVRFDFRGDADWLSLGDGAVSLNPFVGGQPVIPYTGIKASEVFDRVRSGETPEDVASDLGLPSLLGHKLVTAAAGWFRSHFCEREKHES